MYQWLRIVLNTVAPDWGEMPIWPKMKNDITQLKVFMPIVLSILHNWGPGCFSFGLQNCPTRGHLSLTLGAMLPAHTGLGPILVASQWSGAIFMDSQFPETSVPNIIGRQPKAPRPSHEALPQRSCHQLPCNDGHGTSRWSESLLQILILTEKSGKLSYLNLLFW